MYTPILNNKYNFWSNALLFSGLGCFSYLFLVLYYDLSPQHQKILISFWAFLLIVFVFNAIGFCMIYINNWQKRSFQFIIKRKSQLLLDCIITGIILFLLNYLVLSVIKALLEIPSPFTIARAEMRLIILTWLVEIVITSLALTINFYRQLTILHQKTIELEESSIKAQYTALQNQLNPHFLFNSLNTLISEIEYDPGNAVLFTQRLSDVYRYILQSQQQRLVTLTSELIFLNSYIFLHQVRLGDCIHIDNQLSSELDEMKIPSLTLQLLIENVIKHNTINIDYPMTIHLSYLENEHRIVVRNEIRIKQNVTKSSMGLKNLSARYKLICNQDISIENNTIDFTVKIPLLNE